jgi:hypothetical protein
VNDPRGEAERLLEVLLFQIGIVPENLRAFRICCQDLEDSPDRYPHASDTGLAAHFSRLDRDPVERRLEVHDTIICQ